MIRKIVVIASLIACSAHAMKNEKEISVHPITTAEELRTGLKLSKKMFDEILKISPLTNEQQAWYRTPPSEKEKLKYNTAFYLERGKSTFLKQNEKIIGFLVTMPTPSAHTITIKGLYFDDEYIKKPQKLEVVKAQCLKFIRKNHEIADRARCTITIPKDNETMQKLLTKAGFTKFDDYFPEFRPQLTEVWEQDIPK